MSNQAVVLWTGGKDCCLALFRAKEMGLNISCLATFIPEGEVYFKAHPIDQMKAQSKSLNLPLHFLKTPSPFFENYINNLRWLKESQGIDLVITGDIDLVEGKPNWIQECCEKVGLKTLMPLWQTPREDILREIVQRNLQVKVSWINHSEIPKSWLGRYVDSQFIDEIKELSSRTGIDICGENGEYHTMLDFSIHPDYTS